MDNKKLSNDEISKELSEISTILSSVFRNMENKQERMEVLESLKVSNGMLRVLLEIFEKGIENEDYETCDAIREYMSNLGYEIVKN